jgi:DNA-binding beta-propeller fold protein YncE
MGTARRPRRRAGYGPAVIAVAAWVAAGCESPVPFYPPGQGAPDAPVIAVGGAAPATLDGKASASAAPRSDDTPGAPNVYAATGPGMLGPASRDVPPRVYVPNAATGTADVIDQRTGRLLGRVRTGGAPALIQPGWNLRRLWVFDLVNETAMPIAPQSTHRGEALRISSPGPLYFTADGRDAFLMAGRHARIDFRHPVTMEPRGAVRVPCRGATSADYSADASFLVASCPGSGRLIRVDPARRSVTTALRLPAGSHPGELRLAPDGRTFLVADTAKGGLWQVDAARLRVTGFVRTGPGAHGLVLDRRSEHLYVLGSDGTVWAVHLATRRVSRLWRTPSGRSPLAGGVSAGGETLWLSDPASGTVYAVSARTGRTLHTVKVGGRPGSPCVFPQPARYSLGGPGLYR